MSGIACRCRCGQSIVVDLIPVQFGSRVGPLGPPKIEHPRPCSDFTRFRERAGAIGDRAAMVAFLRWMRGEDEARA